MRRKALALIPFILWFGFINAQDEPDEEKYINRNGVYVEFGGNGGDHGFIGFLDMNIPAMITINYERIVPINKKKNVAFRLGAGYMPNNWTNYAFPFEVSYLFGAKSHVFEMGIGLSYLASFKNNSSSEALVLFGRIGYRYRGKKGLLLRAGFTPVVDFDRAFFDGRIFDVSFANGLFAGISIGYSF